MNREPYLFSGVVLPERAQLSLQFSIGFSHIYSRVEGIANVSIILNQVSVIVETEHKWDIFDLRNVVKDIIYNNLAMVGYILGYAYDFEVTRVINRELNIDYVFGIDIPCLVKRNIGIDLGEALENIRTKTIGKNGVLLNRCFVDLISSMKYANDTVFYCYRAIESLRHHCAVAHNISHVSKTLQWEKFRLVAGCTEDVLLQIKNAADPLRHGEVSSCSSVDREMLFIATWNVVEGYLRSIM